MSFEKKYYLSAVYNSCTGVYSSLKELFLYIVVRLILATLILKPGLLYTRILGDGVEDRNAAAYHMAITFSRLINKDHGGGEQIYFGRNL